MIENDPCLAEGLPHRGWQCPSCDEKVARRTPGCEDLIHGRHGGAAAGAYGWQLSQT
ncbi:hypothetical protein [Mycolicibacterium sp. P1-5]|uniref:hypothetical protein n=1 Tax=Mycolicibacterium sp. P1-5 TaxID=2024617 RepID=UPI00188455A5|nr:hypothetical protein [Mycolicibacterium sp. P1-5]